MSSEESGSYRIGEARFRDASAELERLRIQAEVLWPAELTVLERQGLRRDANVLEAGCGPGYVTSLLLGFLEGGSVTALDVDGAMLEHARRVVGDDPRVRFVEASVTATGLPDGAFDAVLVRYVLQHVPGVAAALAELTRVLRPGGRLFAVDADFALATLSDPEPPFVRELMDAVVEGQRLQGGDGHIGRKLPRLLREAGLSDLAVDVAVTHSVVVGREPIRQIIPDQALDHMEQAGLISPELAAQARDYLARIDAGEQPFEGMEVALVVSGSA